MSNYLPKYSSLLGIILCVVLIVLPGCENNSDDSLLSLLGLGTGPSNPYNGTGQGALPGVPASDGGNVYLVGTGIYDITGPAAEIGMMGYADMNQKTSGIHTRLRARAFVIGDGRSRMVFVSADLGMIFQVIKSKVCEKISRNPELARFYNEKNVILSATHTHSAPGGYSGYLLYDVTIAGFIREHAQTIIDGIYKSILNAHNNVKPGKVLLAKGTLDNCGGNRSPLAYDNNPAAEKEAYGSTTDKSFTLLKLVTLDGEEIGMVNWFAVHPTCIGPVNTLISSDSKGYASYLFEKDRGTDYLATRTFVAAFAQANAGDVSPNVDYGQAPAYVDFAHNPSLKNAVLGQYAKAKELYDGASNELAGPVEFRHEYLDMGSVLVEEAGCTTCAAAMGASFSAGSVVDNPSPAPLFPAGTTVDSLNWSDNAASTFLQTFLSGIFAPFWPATQNAAYKACHAQKPILIPTGLVSVNLKKIPMTPEVMPLQVVKIGSLALVAVPNEVTTMSGRRLKKMALDELKTAGVDSVVIAAMANAYTSYLATPEEYATQSYEGACTQFGPNELAAYLQEYRKLCRAIVDGTDIAPGPAPRDIWNETVDFSAKVVLDDKPIGKKFGDVATQPNAAYTRGDIVTVQFWGGHPNNDYRTQGTFLVVEKIVNGSAVAVARDWDPETTYQWMRNGVSASKITITWDTGNAAPGTYRIRHLGNWKSGWTGIISPYEGVSNTFAVK